MIEATDAAVVNHGSNELGPRDSEPSIRRSDAEPPELLLVDDDRETNELLADALEAEGYRVRMAGDGQEGLARLDEGLPSLMVLDVEMPRIGGSEMALQMFLRDAGREQIPILLCSASLNLSRIASQIGTPYFLPKPYTLDAMMKLIARVLLERTPPTPRPRTAR